jgi:hypothetical protein
MEKMKKISQIAQSIKDNVHLEDLNEMKIKMTGMSGTKFKDSFGQDLTVPCIPNQLPDGNLN